MEMGIKKHAFIPMFGRQHSRSEKSVHNSHLLFSSKSFRMLPISKNRRPKIQKSNPKCAIARALPHLRSGKGKIRTPVKTQKAPLTVCSESAFPCTFIGAMRNSILTVP